MEQLEFDFSVSVVSRYQYAFQIAILFNVKSFFQRPRPPTVARRPPQRARVSCWQGERRAQGTAEAKRHKSALPRHLWVTNLSIPGKGVCVSKTNSGSVVLGETSSVSKSGWWLCPLFSRGTFCSWEWDPEHLHVSLCLQGQANQRCVSFQRL